MDDEPRKYLRIRVSGDGTYSGTTVEVIDADGEAIGHLGLCRELKFHLTPSEDHEDNGFGVLELTLWDVEAHLEVDAKVLAMSEPHPDFASVLQQ